MVNQLPNADRIQGVQLEAGPTPDRSIVRMQYTDAQSRWHDLRMGFLDAMYLLNLLRAIQLDEGFEMPDDPREG